MKVEEHVKVTYEYSFSIDTKYGNLRGNIKTDEKLEGITKDMLDSHFLSMITDYVQIDVHNGEYYKYADIVFYNKYTGGAIFTSISIEGLDNTGVYNLLYNVLGKYLSDKYNLMMYDKTCSNVRSVKVDYIYDKDDILILINRLCNGE